MKIGLAACAAILAASPALATSPANPFSADSVVLDLRGIDLTSVQGQQRLAIRVDQAADAVCGTGMSTIHLALAEQTRACRTDVIAEIQTRINAASASRETRSGAQLAMR